MCERALFSLKQLQEQCGSLSCVPPSLSSSLPCTLQLEEAKLHWERGEQASAMALLNKLLDRLKMVGKHASPNVRMLFNQMFVDVPDRQCYG